MILRTLRSVIPRGFTYKISTTTGAFRTSHQDVYLWPSLNEHEKTVIRDAFYQISRRTCIKFVSCEGGKSNNILRFNELDYKPWYHSGVFNLLSAL